MNTVTISLEYFDELRESLHEIEKLKDKLKQCKDLFVFEAIKSEASIIDDVMLVIDYEKFKELNNIPKNTYVSGVRFHRKLNK